MQQQLQKKDGRQKLISGAPGRETAWHVWGPGFDSQQQAI